MATKQQKFEHAFYQLVAFGKWVHCLTQDYTILARYKTSLFDMEKDEWKNIPRSTLVLLPSLMYVSDDGNLSMYDLEVLESCGFKERENGFIQEPTPPVNMMFAPPIG